MKQELIDIALCGNCKYRDKKEGVCTIKPRFDKKGNVIEEKAKVTINEKGCSDFDIKQESDLKEIYRNLVDILKKYCDLKEEYYSLVAVWIIGTYFHDQFISYPYLFFNAMRGSGKSRIMRLVSTLSNNGQMLNSLTEAVLFRTTGTLCIDEFEGLNRKGNEQLRELLNSAYKKGTSVKRMKKKKTLEGEEQVVEEFSVYRPIAIANIWGMENVLADRCLTIILEKSNKKQITKLMEIFDQEKETTLTKELFSKESCSLCSLMTFQNIYKEWNDYIYTNYTNNTNNTNYTNYTLIKKLSKLDIEGRHLELAMPLFIIASEIEEKVLDQTILTFANIIKDKKEEDMVENKDISLYDFLSQEVENTYYHNIKGLTQKFKEYLGTDEDWMNSKWVGRALKRLNLIIDKRRVNRGVEVTINYKKAKEKIRMFK